jgi:predicted acetyltransferase
VTLTVRPITAAEAPLFCARMARGFGSDARDDDHERLLAILAPERTSCAFAGAELVGTCAAFTFDLTVPGGALPMAGTTMITVQPTHRRRGALRAMMEAHLRDARAHDEPLAGLWASEASIYARFGYGIASHGLMLKVDGRAVEFRGDPPPGRVSLVEPERAAYLLPVVYERVRTGRPGMFTRSETWWTLRVIRDPEHARQGRSAKRFVVHEGPEGPDGYAIYRQEAKWTNELPEGTVHLLELVASSGAAHEALWRFLLRIDLHPHLDCWNVAVDDELPWRVTSVRSLRRQLCDSLWIRLLDVPRALAGRRYRERGRIRIGVHDATVPDCSGTYELESDGDVASCARVDAPPDVELPAEVLGAVYLGGTDLAGPARAGLVRGSPEAVAATGRLFAWTPAPWCPEMF